MSEREWLIPCTLLTAVSAALALAAMPDYSGIRPALAILPWWLMIAALLATLFGPAGLFSMMARKESRPLAHVVERVRFGWRSALLMSAGVLVAGLNMISFMWTKPLLNYLVPFRADPLLAAVDHAIFLGHDPSAYLQFLNSVPMAVFYHRGWFAMMIITLLLLLSRPPSPEKSAAITSYFLLWSVFGPLVHCLFPAGGPIFFAQLGYGDRFSAIQLPENVGQMSEYLWTIYAGQGFGPGAGISAMPSLHIATTSWMIIVFALFARRWLPAVAAFGGLILLLSVSLGWHYAIDGIVGAAGAMSCYLLMRRAFDEQAWWRVRGSGAVPVTALCPTTKHEPA